jgi:hypothetical protein
MSESKSSDEPDREDPSSRPSVRKKIEEERARRIAEAEKKQKTTPTQTKHQQPVPQGRAAKSKQAKVKER